MDRNANNNGKPADNLEYAVSQLVDGTLSDFDRRNLGDALAGDVAKRWADEDRRLTALLRDHDPLPDVDFDALSARVSAALADEPAYAPAPLKLPTAASGPLPMHLWRRLSIAAGVALAATLGWHFLDRPAATTPTGPVGQTLVRGPSTTLPTGTIAVKVGPTDDLVRRGLAAGIGTEPTPSAVPKVVITSADADKPNDGRPF